jgi:hypothetical protein
MANIAQPATTKGPAVSGPNAFGASPNDSSRAPIAAKNYFQTNDNTQPTNLKSPLTLGASVTDIVVPLNATNVTFIAGAACQVSEDATMSQFIALPAGIAVTLDVSRLGHIYANAPTGTPTLSFHFTTV